MREILFRGKDIVGHWYEGNLAVLKENISTSGCTVKTGAYISNEYGLPFAYPVIPETVGQFTGASDRGKKVFEHDLVRVECEGGEITGVIEFELGEFIIATNDDEDGWRFLIDFIDAEGNLIGEVIGNIHEQKEQS